MPPETAEHECTWMAWPSSGYTLGESSADADTARATWAAVAHAVSDFEPVRMVVDPDGMAAARSWLDSRVEILEAPLDDAWMRDIGPTFVHRAGELGAVDWRFNGWGGQQWATWEKDARIARFVADAAGARLIPSELVNEGGGIHVDGAGTVLVTETVQLDQGRNPSWTKSEVENELVRTLGVDRIIWAPRGLTRDYDSFGTRGHIDIVATMPAPGRVLLHVQTDPAHPDYGLDGQIRAVLPDEWTVTSLRAPARLADRNGPVDHSYVNHYVCNGGVIACGFDDPHDAEAATVLAEAYPDRAVVFVDARPLFERGGGVHCITQQQPAIGT